MTYKSYKNFKFAPKTVQKFVIVCQQNLLDDKLGTEIVINNESKIRVAFDGKTPVGLVMYNSYETDNIWIYLIYIDIEYRRKGICTKFLKYIIKENPDIKIEYGTHPENSNMILAGNLVGFNRRCIIMEYNNIKKE